MTNRRKIWFPTVIGLAVMLCLSWGAVAQDADRKNAVREHGAAVMPFSMADTLHVFEKTPEGGVQRVEARPGHADQVLMIQHHLNDIAERFARRDFSGPAQIHGETMPGLEELKAAKPEELSVAYRTVEDGAEVTYVGHTEAVRDAIHRWFDAQLSDHGHDATGHHHHGT